MEKKAFQLKSSWKEVAQANQRFYDQIAGVYEQADSRRAAQGTSGQSNQMAHEWLDSLLGVLSQQLNQRFPEEKKVFLDMGAGSGFLAFAAKSHFEEFCLVDISKAMLDKIQLPNARKIVADCSHVPLPDESIHFVGAFAVLHHLHSPEVFFSEGARLLKSGGLIYSDHDISKEFVESYGPLLKLYRNFFDHEKNYLKLCPSITHIDYQLSEFHGDSGLSGISIARSLERMGLKLVRLEHHWEGAGFISLVLSKIGLKEILSREGIAPFLRIVAQKV